jgi:hypothetical protein
MDILHSRVVDTNIKVGDRVRSYDFPHRDDCFIEGHVTHIKEWEGCERYYIRVELVCWDGKIVPNDPMLGHTVRPPVNGIPTLLSDRPTSFVHKQAESVLYPG